MELRSLIGCVNNQSEAAKVQCAIFPCEYRQLNRSLVRWRVWFTGWPKKVLSFVFHPKIVFYNFFPYFSGGVDSRPGRFFWHQYGSKLTLYFAGADKNHQGVLCRKISSSDTEAMQEIFGRKNVPDGRTIQRLVAKFRKTDACSISELSGRCSQSRDRSSFGIIPENIQNFPENQHAVFHKKMASQEHQF